MRFVTWNCRIGGFRKKVKHIVPMMPDVLAVQEVEPLDKVRQFAGDCQPTFRDRATCPEFPKRSIGMFSYTDARLRAVDLADIMHSFRRYEVNCDGVTFNVAVAWPYKTKIAKDAYRQAHEGLTRHRTWIKRRPTVVLGDFNQNASFKGSNWKDLKEIADSLGLVSAYHHFFREPFGSETRPTYFHRGAKASAFHLDYCFVPSDWAAHISSVEVGQHADWCTLSDHVPLIVDLDIHAKS